MPGLPGCLCEFADRPEVCFCVSSGWSRGCELAYVLGRADYRDLIRRRTLAGPAAQAERLALVLGCSARGPVLPVSLQPECGCAELSECRSGRGKTAGRVTLAECLECVSGEVDLG